MSGEISAYSKSRKAKALRRNILVGVLLAVLLGGASYLVLTRYLVVQDVMVQGTELYSKKELLSACHIEKGTPLIALSKKEISRNVEENFPYLIDVKVEYDLPGTVNVTFQEEFGKLALNLGTELFSIDTELNVLAKEKPDSQIPRIRLLTEDVSRCVVGEKLCFFEAEFPRQLTELIADLKRAEMLEKISTIDICDKFNIKLRYLDRFEILIGEMSDMKQKLNMVKEVIKDLGDAESGRIDISDPNNAYVKLRAQIQKKNKKTEKNTFFSKKYCKKRRIILQCSLRVENSA